MYLLIVKFKLNLLNYLLLFYLQKPAFIIFLRLSFLKVKF